MDSKDRIAELMALMGGLSAAWPTLSRHLSARRNDCLEQLVAANDEEIRGRIKELNDLLELPERLQQEAFSLQHPQQDAELP